ncbi:hypothetical protein BV20DRAFT_979851 [Pilatotrama ljubarskyi]|nr:hypothetical protein BV20DRAFT_979851 [Pilatotrama ljubarskyi]
MQCHDKVTPVTAEHRRVSREYGGGGPTDNLNLNLYDLGGVGEMTRGNQREMDRLKAQKKAQQAAKSKKESAASLQQRREKDAAALREKQKASDPSSHAQCSRC